MQVEQCAAAEERGEVASGVDARVAEVGLPAGQAGAGLAGALRVGLEGVIGRKVRDVEQHEDGCEHDGGLSGFGR